MHPINEYPRNEDAEDEQDAHGAHEGKREKAKKRANASLMSIFILFSKACPNVPRLLHSVQMLATSQFTFSIALLWPGGA